MNYKTGAFLYGGVILMSFIIGDFMMRAAFFGCLTLLGIAATFNSIQPLKWLITKTSKIIDLSILAFTIIATASFGLNITAALTIAGLGFTLVYAPYLREKAKENKNNKKSKPIKNGINNYNRM